VEETVRTIVWAAPLSAVLVTGLFWLLRNWITARLTTAIQHEYDTALERHKAQLKAQFDTALESHKAALKAQADAALEVHKAVVQQGAHVLKSQFDMEFSGFQKVWSAVSLAVDHTVRVLRHYAYSERSGSRGTKRKAAEEADRAFFGAQRSCQELGPFLPRELHAAALDLLSKCKEEIDLAFHLIPVEERNDPSYDQKAAMDAADKSIGDIERRWRGVADQIRTRLAQLAAGKGIAT